MSEDLNTVPHDSLERSPGDVLVPHADHSEAGGFEHLRPCSVVCSLVRSVERVALKLQDEPPGRAVEIHDEAVQDVLATKLQGKDAPVPQQRPRVALGRRRCPT